MARDVSVIFRVVDTLSGPVREMNGRIKGFADGIAGAARAIGAAFAAVAAGAFLKSSIEEAIEAEKVMGRLKLAVNNAGREFGGEFKEQAEASVKAVQRLSVATDDDLNDALTRMITTTGDTEGSLANLQLAADLAAYSGKSLGDAADIVGKAMVGNTKGLKEFGISTTDSAVAMRLLQEKVGGFAAQEAQTLGGRLTQLQNGWNDFKESVGNAILSNQSLGEGVGVVTGLLADLAAWIEKNEGQISAFIQRAVELGRALWEGIIQPVGELLLPVLGLAWEGWQRLLEVITYVARTGPAMVQQLVGKVVSYFGRFAEGVENLAKKVGLNLNLMGSEMRATGDQWAKDGKAAAEAAGDAFTAALGRIQDAGEGHERKLTETVRKGGQTRTTLTAEQTKDLQRQLLALAGIQASATIKITDTALKEMVRFNAANKENLKGLGAAILKANQEWEDYSAAARRATGKEGQKDLEETAKKAKQLVDTVAGLARGVLDAAQAVGGLDAGMASALTSAINLGESFGKIASGDLFGGITQGVGAIANLGKSLFGKSEQEKKNEAALKANTAKLEEHRRKIGDLISLQLTGTQLSGVQGALQAFAAQTSGGKRLGKGWGDIIGRELLGRGVSVADLDEVAKTLGIDIRPGGHLNSQAVLQLLEALKLVEPTKFGNTFADQRARIDQGVTIGAITDPLSEVVKLVTTGTIGSPALKAALEGLDLTTAAGKKSGVAALQSLFSNVGTLSARDLGGLTGSEFLDAIQWLVGLLQEGQDLAEETGGPTADTPAPGPSDEPDTPSPGGDGGPASEGPGDLAAVGTTGLEGLEIFRSMDATLTRIARDITSMASLAPTLRASDAAADREPIAVHIDQLVLEATDVHRTEDLLDALFDRVQGRAAEEYRMYRRGLGTEVTT